MTELEIPLMTPQDMMIHRLRVFLDLLAEHQREAWEMSERDFDEAVDEPHSEKVEV